MFEAENIDRALLGGLLALGAGILAFVFLWSDRQVTYSLSVEEVLARPVDSKSIRTTGWMIRGSLCKVQGECEYRLRLADDELADASVARPTLDVRYPGCVIPDTMRYDAPGVEVEVVAKGKLRSKGQLSAIQIMAKCPSKYWAPDPTLGGRIKSVPACH